MCLGCFRQADSARALIQPDTALQHVNSPGRYAFSSPEGTPVSSLDLDAISRQPGAFPGKSPEASPLGTDYSVTPASSIGMGPRIVPIMRTLSGASSGSELGLAVAPVVPEVLKPTSTIDGSGSDIESIRLSKAPVQGQRNAETSDSDSGAASLSPLRSLGCLVTCTRLLVPDLALALLIPGRSWYSYNRGRRGQSCHCSCSCLLVGR